MASVDLGATTPASTSRARASFRVLFASPVGVVAAVTVALTLALAVFAPILWGDRAATFDTANLNSGPTLDHWLGTDNLGRDIGLRVLVATRLAIGLALAATLIGLILGVLFGSLTAIAGRTVSGWAAAAVNIAVAFPGLLLAIFLAAIFGVGQLSAVIALGAAAAPFFARLTQTLVASVIDREYVAAAQVIGIGRFKIFLRHVLPNIGEPLVINATMGAGGHLLAFAALSFLGIGVQAPAFDWGRLLLEGLSSIYVNPMAALGPGLAIVVAGLAFNLTGEVAAQAMGRRTRRPPEAAPDASAAASPATGESGQNSAVLDVRDLTVHIPGSDGWVTPVRGISLSIAAGETVGLVGESGSGKSLTAMAIARLLRAPIRVDAARLDFVGHDLHNASEAEARRSIADSLAVIFQDPSSSLNPVIKVGRQLAEVAEVHQGLSATAASERAVSVLDSVRIPDPARRARQYPHQFSGGMRQRAMIGIGLMGRPRLIIADEPTTALDVTVQRQVLDTLDAARADAGAGLLLISHDIAVVSQLCERVLVMYAGRIVEDLSIEQLRHGARHPYTRALMAAVPDLDTPRDQPLATIPGRPPQAAEVTALFRNLGGCAFAPRCDFATEKCLTEDPALIDSSEALRQAQGTESQAQEAPGLVACWHPQTGPLAGSADGESDHSQTAEVQR